MRGLPTRKQDLPLGSLGGSQGQCEGQHRLGLLISDPHLSLPVVVEQLLGRLHQPLERLRTSVVTPSEIDAVLVR